MYNTIKETIKEIKENLNIDIKYIARDSNGRIYGYTHKPYKGYFYWQVYEGTLIELSEHRAELQGITFKDKEPTKIEDVL